MWAKCNVPILAILLSGPKMMFVALMISLELISRVKSVYTDVYNFPMLGTLRYLSNTANYGRINATYGSVTIVHKRMALCAVENVFQIDTENFFYIFEATDIHALYVVAGSDLMQSPHGYEDDKVQTVNVERLYIALNSAFLLDLVRKKTDWNNLRNKYSHLVKNANTLDRQTVLSNWKKGKFPSEFKLNPFQELQWDVVILVLKDPGFKWSAYVLPIPFHWKDNNNLEQQYSGFWDKISAVEKHPHKFVPCSVPGWSSIGNNEIVYHRVVYVRFKDCAEAICGVYPSTCLKYLNDRQHVCFKSLSFADSCIMDQGAPVVCNWADAPENNPIILGILVKAFECGTQGLPLVFTRTYAIAAFAKISLEKGELEFDKQEPALLDPAYTEGPV